MCANHRPVIITREIFPAANFPLRGDAEFTGNRILKKARG